MVLQPDRDLRMDPIASCVRFADGGTVRSAVHITKRLLDTLPGDIEPLFETICQGAWANSAAGRMKGHWVPRCVARLDEPS